MYEINPSDLEVLLQRFQTQEFEKLSKEEMLQFLINPNRMTSQVQQEINLQQAEELLVNKKVAQQQNKCILDLSQREVIDDIYNSLDTFGSQFVSVKQLIHKIRCDARGARLLKQPAVYIPVVNKILPFDRLVYELEQSMLHAPEGERRERSEINHAQLHDFLENYQRKDIPTKDKVIYTERLTGKFAEGDIIEVSKVFIQFLKTSFQNVEKKAEYYVRKYDFLEELRNQSQYRQFERLNVRDKPYKDLPVETVNETCQRMLVESDEFIDIDELIDFFTRKGRPIIIQRKYEDLKQQQVIENQVQLWSREDHSSPDDRDLKHKRKERKLQKIKGVEEAQYLLEKEKEESQKRFGAKIKSDDEQLKITLPVPYKFDKREKNKGKSIVQRRLEEWLAEKKMEEDLIVESANKFRATKIPKHVRDRNKYAARPFL